MKKAYHIKPEFLHLWGSDATESTIVYSTLVSTLARDWGKSVDELMDQLEEAPVTKKYFITEFDGQVGSFRSRPTGIEYDSDYIRQHWFSDGETYGEYDTEEEARAAFARLSPSVYLAQSNAGWVLERTAYTLEVEVLDEDGDEVDFDTLEDKFSACRIDEDGRLHVEG